MIAENLDDESKITSRRRKAEVASAEWVDTMAIGDVEARAARGFIVVGAVGENVRVGLAKDDVSSTTVRDELD